MSAMTALNCSGADCVTAGVPWYGVYNISMPPNIAYDDKMFAILASQAVAMVDALTKAGGKPELKIYEGANYGWAGATPEATLDFHRRAIADTFAFFDRVLKPER